MMKKTFLAVSLILIVISQTSYQGQPNPKINNTLEQGFISPPDSIQTSVYWYWISNNISKEGVVKDLQAMKKAGINRAFIGDIGLEDVPYGKVKILSEEWWDILHTALKTATELDIEIGIFNSPGWSQSGGPWVQANEAMRYLSSSTLRVEGPQQLKRKLPIPEEPFQDVKVIAYPVTNTEHRILNNQNGTLTSTPILSDLNKIVDGNDSTAIEFPNQDELVINFESDTPFTARSLSIQTSQEPVFAHAILKVESSEGQSKILSEFTINRSNPALNVGFKPYAPIVISFPEATSAHYQLIIKDFNGKGGLSEVILATSPRVANYSEKTLAKMFQTPLPYWKEYQWPLQPEPQDQEDIVKASSVIDISDRLSNDGTLNWDVPKGEWVILRMGMTPTGTKNAPAAPEATGYEVDKMSKKHVAMHFNAYIGEILKRIPAADRKTFKVVVQDSYEQGGQNFTDGFLQDFQKQYGYDPVPYLPVYNGTVVTSELASDRFLWDMRRLVANKVAYDYVGGLREVSHQHGLHTWLECYGHWGFPSEFLMYGGQSDEIGGEFWSEGDLGNIENRAATSAGHIYGKNRISAESNTSAGSPFARYPGVIKQRGDRFFAEGINNTLLHVYITQPYEDRNPGMNAWFGTEFNRKNTWFSQMDVYTQYLKRVNFMLQQGLNVADAAYFIGEDAPKMTGITDPALPIGYQFDYMNAEVIEKYMTVENGFLTLPHGTQYRILVLPKLETMRPELLSKIKQLVNDGAVVLGPAPSRSPSLQNQPQADQQVKKLASELWADVDGKKIKYRSYGKGMVLDGMNMEQAFSQINFVPDCQLPADSTIHYGHRKLGEEDIYFITNQTDKLQQVTPAFRVHGKQPELWEPTTGAIRNLPAFELMEETTKVPLQLAPYESVFIVFRHQASASRQKGVAANYPAPENTIDLNGPWKVQFDPLQRGPEQPVIFNSLQDWSNSEDEKIKYYSGTAVYNSQFKLNQMPKDQRIVIDLGAFSAMAKVAVNNQYVGGLWTPPYRLDITDKVRKGKNTVQIDVVNTWVNRLVGDSKLPETQRQTWSPVNPYQPDSPLQTSGLIGPVHVFSLPY